MFVGLFVLRLVFDWPNAILMTTEAWLQRGWSVITGILGPGLTRSIADGWTWLLDHIGGVLPGWASPAIPSLREYPLSGIVPLAPLAWVFFVWSKRLEQRIEDLAEWAWASHKGLAPAAEPKPDWRNRVASAFRPFTSFFYRRIWRRGVVPILGITLGLIGLAGAILLSPIWIWRKLRRPPWMA
jgi:hypothetical protein